MTSLSVFAFFVIIYSISFFIGEGGVVKKRSLCENDEMHVDCYHCGPQTCEDLGYANPCKGSMALCRSRCVCTDGFVRDAQRKCIPKNECPSCGGDRNATSGCGNHCGNRCSDYNNVNKTCWTGCRYNNCDCRTGYVYHDILGICVLPNDCLLEEYSTSGSMTSLLSAKVSGIPLALWMCLCVGENLPTHLLLIYNYIKIFLFKNRVGTFSSFVTSFVFAFSYIFVY